MCTGLFLQKLHLANISRAGIAQVFALPQVRIFSVAIEIQKRSQVPEDK